MLHEVDMMGEYSEDLRCMRLLENISQDSALKYDRIHKAKPTWCT